jgi:hypothetical protein
VSKKDTICYSVYTNFIIYINRKLLEKILISDLIVNSETTHNVPIDDFDIVFSNFLVNNSIPIYNFNQKNEIAYIVEDSNYFNEKWENLKDIVSNRYMWLEKYLNKNIMDCLYNNDKPLYKEPIPYLYKINFFTQDFCKELVSMANVSNLWSSGKNEDKRIIGGYEHVPTVDIHLNELGLEDTWNAILDKIIAPIAEKFYVGYDTKGTNIVFVVKYSMDGQKKLRPHHDSSSYTVNIALNEPTEYTGGGSHFLNHDYKNIDAPIGELILHPGKVTHYHQGLPITSGERYILV